ncbi:unnamed protein product, partial [Cladocopium goreaui]
MNARMIWRRVCNGILKLEQHVLDNKEDRLAKQLLDDIGTNALQLTREIFVLGKKCDWSPADPGLKEVCEVLFKVPQTTKASLESAFNALKDRTRQQKAQRMSNWTKWSYLILNRYTSTGGLNSVSLAHDDFNNISSNYAVQEQAQAIPVWKGLKHAALPMDGMPSKSTLEEMWRPGGYMSNRVAAAAIAFTVRSMRDNFQSLHLAWTGRLLVDREVYYDHRSDEFVIALGFFRYAAIVLPCNVMEHDGERYVVPSAEMMAGTHFLICPGIRDDVQHVPTTVVPPGCLPRELNVLTAAKVTGENANILKAALKI